MDIIPDGVQIAMELREQFADQLKTRLKLYQFEMEERGLPTQTIHIEGVLRIIDLTLQFQDIDEVDKLDYNFYKPNKLDELP